MGKTLDQLTPELSQWISAQHMFFVSTAPLSAEGKVNCSPKGLNSFAILDERRVAYLDLTGSGIETVAHLRENGRICLLFCAFEGPPKILRIHGRGEVILPQDDTFGALRGSFPSLPGVRSIVHVNVDRVAVSCGYGVPRYDFVEERKVLVDWAESKGEAGVREYQSINNRISLDGLPGLVE